MNILILEDEYKNYTRLKRLLQELNPREHTDGPVTSITETIKYLQEHEAPDLILADIRLSDGLSFDALEQISVSSPIIFTTAYDEYAIRAFKYNSLDYLLKPIMKEDLANAIEKVYILKSVPRHCDSDNHQNDEEKRLPIQGTVSITFP